MKTIESFPKLINDIFRELELTSQIRIDCTAADETPLSPCDPAIKVVAVNGRKTVVQFLRMVRKLQRKVLADFQELVPQIAPEDLERLVDMAVNRLQKMIQSLQITRDTSPQRYVQSIFWAPAYVHCYLDGVETSDSFVIAEAIVEARGYAWTYHIEIYMFKEKISSFNSNSKRSHINDHDGQENMPEQKIMFNWPLPVVCALMRFFYDNERFEDISFLELSHWISEKFCTREEENLDPNEILKLVENPSRKAIEGLKVKLGECERYLTEMKYYQLKLGAAYDGFPELPRTIARVP